MPTSTAPRTGITRWSAEADPFNRTQTDADHALLDDLVAIDLHDGALAARPAVGIRGRYFTESAASAGLPGTTWREDGVAWRAIGARVLSQSSTDVAQVVAGVTGQTADLQQWRAGASTLGRVDNTGQLFAVGAQLGPSPQTALAAMLGVSPTSAAAIAAIIRGAVSQSADLQQWQTNAGTAVARVDSTGAGTFAALTTAGALAAGSSSITGTSTGRLARWTSAAVGDIPVQVTGFAGQTGDLQQWRSSAGTVLARVDPNGVAAATWGYFGPNPGTGSVAGVVLNALSSGTAIVPLLAKGFAGQTADLQQWQSSSGGQVAAMDASGGLFATNVYGGVRQSIGAHVQAVAAGPTVIPGAWRGAASQTANLTEWQSSAGTVVASVQPTGQGTFAGLQSMGANNFNQPTTQVSPSAGSIPFTIRGAVSQTGDLTEWLSNGGSLIAVIRPDGSAIFHSGASDNTLAGSFGGALGVNSNRLSSAMLSVVADAAASPGAIIRGAASQTGDLQQWQNSAGTVLAKLTAGGLFQLTQAGAYVTAPGGFGGGTAGFGDASARNQFNSNAAAEKPLVVRGVASQSANLQEWQNSAGANVTQLTPAGELRSIGAVAVGDGATMGQARIWGVGAAPAAGMGSGGDFAFRWNGGAGSRLYYNNAGVWTGIL